MIEQQGQDEYKKKLELAEALAQLNSKEKEIRTSKGYGKAYFWSVVMPPMGVWYFCKLLFFSSGEGEDIKAGVISLLLTIVSFLISLWAVAGMFSGVNSQDLQRLKNLTLPESQKEILQLYK